MSEQRKTAIVTGASQGIGAGVVKRFVERGFNVVATSRKMTSSPEVAASAQVALVDGDIGEAATAARIVDVALSQFKSIDILVNNAGIYFTKPFTDYTTEDFRSLVSTNLEGFLYVTQLSIRQMLAQKRAEASSPSRLRLPAIPSGSEGGAAHADKRWTGHHYPPPCHGVRERRYPRECDWTGRRRNTASPGDSTSRDGGPVSHGTAFHGRRHH